MIEKARHAGERGGLKDPWPVLVIANPVNARLIHLTEGVEIFFNARYCEGISQSVKLGIKEALRREAEGIFLFLGDMPFISEETIRSVFSKADQEPERIIRPRYQGIPGFPLYFPSPFFELGLTITGDQGLKSIIKPLSEYQRWIETDDSDSIKDIDGPSDLNG